MTRWNRSGRRARRSRATAVYTFVLVWTASLASAHDTWMVPNASGVRPGSVLTLDLTSGMSFPVLDHAIKPDRIARASLRLSGKATEIHDRSPAKNSLRLSAAARENGIATIWVDTKPKDIELRPEQVREYLGEIGVWDTVGREWEKGGPKSWREIYTKHAKTFVRVGDPGADRSWAESVGAVLEIVPESDPTTLRAGDEFPVRVFWEGQPLPDFPLGLVGAGEKTGAIRKTNSAGQVSFALGRAGWWLLRGTRLTRSAQVEVDWESHFATLTFLVTPAR